MKKITRYLLPAKEARQAILDYVKKKYKVNEEGDVKIGGNYNFCDIDIEYEEEL